MTIRGMVGEITDVRIRGWALDSEAPDSKLEIALMEDDAILSKTTNGLFREDLAQKGLSETHGGFEISVPENCFGKDLKVVVLGHDHVLPRINIKKAPACFSPASGPAPTAYAAVSMERPRSAHITNFLIRQPDIKAISTVILRIL